MENEEVFKPIEGFEDYEVSNFGSVRSLNYNRTNEIKILKSKITKKGYHRVILHKNGKGYFKLVHRLVAIAFIPNPNNYKEVNHKDENKLNNFVWVNDDGSIDLEKSNLEWCTREYNNNYGSRNERASKAIAISLTNHPSKSKPVVAVDSEGNVVYEFPSTAEAGRNGFNQQNVSQCCNGLRKTHKGYRWYYKEDWLKKQATHDRVACGKIDFNN